MPNLTLETALAEYPDECLTVLDTGIIIPDLKNSAEAINLYNRLHSAALRWLAGKRSFFKRLPGRRNVTWQWPPDPLRWLLEEVRAQLKLETPKCEKK